jgi:methyl-accepting chemotaxis protein
MKLTLGKKLGLGFGVILALAVLSAILAYVRAGSIKQIQDRAMDVGVPTIGVLKDVQRGLNQAQSIGREVILAGADPDRRETGNRTFAASWDDTARDIERLDALEPNWASQENRNRLSDLKMSLPRLRQAQESAMNLAASGEHDAIAKAGREFADKTTTINAEVKKPLAEMADSFTTLLAQDQEGMRSETRMMYLTTSLTTIIALAIGIFVAVSVSRSIARTTQSVLAQAEAIASGDLRRADLKVRSQDELGDLTAAINKMSNSLKSMIMAIMANSLQVASASEQLSHTSQQISANSEKTSVQAKVVSDSALHVSQNLQTVATGAEEMGVSIREIAKNATEAASVATSAVKVAETTTATVSKLGESSNEIGQVIKVITSIAQQTNLLALNATIEAARAGEAGKGFAVVANEVKELAKETAKATEDISRKIETIQTDTKAAVKAIASISDVINQVNGISNTIATAVEEQNATTNEMARNVSEAANSSGEITSNINGVAQAAESTSRGAMDTQKASQQLVETSAELRRLVEQFKIDAVAAAPARAQMRSRAAHAGS